MTDSFTTVDNNRLAEYKVSRINLADGSVVQSMSAILPLISKVDEASATVTYTGYALRGVAGSEAKWFIFKDEIVGTVTTRLMASEPWQFDQVWDNRASLSYS